MENIILNGSPARMAKKLRRHFVAYFFYNGLNINLGININLEQPNIEIHIPFGFIRVGWKHGRLTDIVSNNAFGYNTYTILSS